jgi:hypothetical protein
MFSLKLNLNYDSISLLPILFDGDGDGIDPDKWIFYL